MDASKVINTPSPTHGLQLHSCSITTQAVFTFAGLVNSPRIPEPGPPRASADSCDCRSCSAQQPIRAQILALGCALDAAAAPAVASDRQSTVRSTRRKLATAFVCPLSRGSASSRVSGANRADISGANRPVTRNPLFHNPLSLVHNLCRNAGIPLLAVCGRYRSTSTRRCRSLGSQGSAPWTRASLRNV